MWRYDPILSLLSLDTPVDDSVYWVMVDGRFDFPLVFFPYHLATADSIRVIVDGVIGIEGTDYAFDSSSGTITLLKTDEKTLWFCLTYMADLGQASIGSMTPEHLTRAMNAHLGFPFDGNCAPIGESKTHFLLDTEFLGDTAPWLLQLLPKGEGYVGSELWPRDFTYDKTTREIMLKEPIDTDRFGIYALMPEE